MSTLSWSGDDFVAVGRGIGELFSIQRKSITEDDIRLFVSRLSERGLPSNAVVAGLKNLEEAEIGTITLRVMIDAAHSMVCVDEPMGVCPYCDKVGSILMWRETERDTKTEVALGCICIKGDDYVRRFAATKWKGALIQHKTDGGGKIITLTLRFPDILQRKEIPSQSGWAVI